MYIICSIAKPYDWNKFLRAFCHFTNIQDGYMESKEDVKGVYLNIDDLVSFTYFVSDISNYNDAVVKIFGLLFNDHRIQL